VTADAPTPAPPTAGTDRVPPVALVLGGVVSVQFGAALAATLFDDAGAAGTGLLRLAFAALILLVLVRPRPSRYRAADLRLAGLFGLCLGAMNVTFYEALARIPLGVAVTIEFAGPLGVAVALSRRRPDLACAALAAIGILLLADPGGGGLDPAGVGFALAAAVFWAAYILLAQRTGRIFAGADAVALGMVAAAAVALVPGIASGGADLLDPRLLVLGAGVALASSVIPYSLETEALRRLPAHVFGVLMSLEPAVAALAGLAVLGQRLGPRELAGMALVVVASVGVSRAAARHDAGPPGTVPGGPVAGG
jgi:inner membrane transporter RhtA